MATQPFLVVFCGQPQLGFGIDYLACIKENISVVIYRICWPSVAALQRRDAY